MAENAPPSLDPANENVLVGLLKETYRKMLMQTDDMLPAQVVSFDRDSNRAQVQPLIVAVTTDGQIVRRAQVASVPVFQLGGGGFVLNFPLKPGNLGWIKASDRDISLFTQSYTSQAPNTRRLHSFEDSVFFPDVMTGWDINSEDEENIVLQTLDGSQRVAIWSDRVKITSDSKVVIDAPLTEFTGAIINGTNPAYDDYAEFGGSVRAIGEVTAKFGTDDIALSTHVHVNSGGTGDSGQPKPV